MTPQFFFLTLPSAIIFVLLIFHSWKTLGSRDALGFWLSVSAYGLFRGMFVQWVNVKALGSAVPYVIHNPTLKIFGVALQEVLGWGIVAYLGWWLGDRFCSVFLKSNQGRAFVCALWAFAFLGSISLAVEAAAVGSGWWHWQIRNYSMFFDNVPMVGLLDWAFVAFDFLLPFLLWRQGKSVALWIKAVSLSLFPLHFLAHCFVFPMADWFPVSVYALGHWAVLLFCLWGALTAEDQQSVWPRQDKKKGSSILPLTGLGILLVCLLASHLVVVREAKLLTSLVPVIVILMLSRTPVAGQVASGLSLLLGALRPAFAPASFPWLGALGFKQLRKLPRSAAYGVLGGMLVLGMVYDAHSHKRTDTYLNALNNAVSHRDSGNWQTAARELETLRASFPDQHAGRMILGEIYFKTGQPAKARPVFEEAVHIKQSTVKGYQYLAIIALQEADTGLARSQAERGLFFEPGDATLLYIQHLSLTPGKNFVIPEEAMTPALPYSLHTLANQLRRPEHAVAMLQQGLMKYPQEVRLYESLLKQAETMGDEALALKTALRWQEQMPRDQRAKAAAERLLKAREDQGQ